MNKNSFPRILVVDDEISISRFLRIALSNDYMILEAESGSQALQLAALQHLIS